MINYQTEIKCIGLLRKCQLIVCGNGYFEGIQKAIHIIFLGEEAITMGYILVCNYYSYMIK